MSSKTKGYDSVMIISHQSMMRALLLLILFLISCPAPQTDQQKDTPPVVIPREEFQVMIPKETWPPIFFKEIDERAAIAKLPSLRAAALPKDDLETRLWVGFGLSALQGFQLKRSNGQWAGVFIRGIRPGLARSDYQMALQPPKSGWGMLWQRLVSNGLLTLPDARSISCNPDVLDGIGYVVEYNVDNTYRTYMYSNPQYADCKEAKQMIAIVEIIYEEFDSQLPRH